MASKNKVEKIKEQNSKKLFVARAINGVEKCEAKRRELMWLDLATTPKSAKGEGYSF